MLTTPNLKKVRIAKYLTARELAQRAGVTQTTLSRCENGAPTSIATVRKLAKALRCLPEDIAVVTEDDPREAQ